MQEDNPVSRLLDRLELLGALAFILLISIYGVWRYLDPIGAAQAATKFEVMLYDFLSSTVFDVVFVGGLLLGFLLGVLYLAVVSIDFASWALENAGLKQGSSLPDGPVGDYERDHSQREPSRGRWESLKGLARKLAMGAAVVFPAWYLADPVGFRELLESVSHAVRTGSISLGGVLLTLLLVVSLLIVYLILSGVYRLLTHTYARLLNRLA